MKNGVTPWEEWTNACKEKCNCIIFVIGTSKFWELHGLTQYIWRSARKLRRGAYWRIGRQVVLTIQICRSSLAVFQGARGNDGMTIWGGSFTPNSILQAIGFGQLAWIFANSKRVLMNSLYGWWRKMRLWISIKYLSFFFPIQNHDLNWGFSCLALCLFLFPPFLFLI